MLTTVFHGLIFFNKVKTCIQAYTYMYITVTISTYTGPSGMELHNLTRACIWNLSQPWGPKAGNLEMFFQFSTAV
jgi:hypothetical protein